MRDVKDPDLATRCGGLHAKAGRGVYNFISRPAEWLGLDLPHKEPKIAVQAKHLP